jgi:hypothetical protein
LRQVLFFLLFQINKRGPPRDVQDGVKNQQNQRNRTMAALIPPGFKDQRNSESTEKEKKKKF